MTIYSPRPSMSNSDPAKETHSLPRRLASGEISPSHLVLLARFPPRQSRNRERRLDLGPPSYRSHHARFSWALPLNSRTHPEFSNSAALFIVVDSRNTRTEAYVRSADSVWPWPFAVWPWPCVIWPSPRLNDRTPFLWSSQLAKASRAADYVHGYDPLTCGPA